MSRRTNPLIPLALAALALVACDAPGPGVEAYRAGRFEDAHTALVQASDAAGDDASARLLHNRALSAFRAGKTDDADRSAERAAAAGDPAVARLAGFLRGNVAFSRAALAALQARTVEAEPFAFDIALAYARTARGRFQVAAMSGPDWPAARRNVERSLLQIAELERQKAEAVERASKKASTESTPIVVRNPDDAPEEVAPDDQAGAAVTELSPAQIAALLDTLAQKETEKNSVRRKRQAERGTQVERDW